MSLNIFYETCIFKMPTWYKCNNIAQKRRLRNNFHHLPKGIITSITSSNRKSCIPHKASKQKEHCLVTERVCDVADLQAFRKVLINLCRGNGFMALLHKFTSYQLSVGKHLFGHCNSKYIFYRAGRLIAK